MYPDSDKDKWILQAAQTGLLSVVNEQSTPIVTNNQFAPFSKELSVTSATNIAQNQAPAVIPPTSQEQKQQSDQQQQRDKNNNDNNRHPTDKQLQQQQQANKDQEDDNNDNN